MKTVMYMLFISMVLLVSACSSSSKYDALAQCMSAHNDTMYGAYWCPHCQNTKAEFGSSFKYINYIECGVQGDVNAQQTVCTNDNITGYPTWILNGTRYEGELNLYDLANHSGCTAALLNASK